MKPLNIYVRHLFGVMLLLLATGAQAQPEVRRINNTAFTYGEKITYKVRYNLYFNVNVGEVLFEVKPKASEVAGNTCYNIVATAKTFGFYDPFYKVRDKYESFVETTSLLPLVSYRDVSEGGFKFNETAVFNHDKKIIKSKKRTQTAPAQTMDVLTTLYYARTLDFTGAKPGQKYMMHTFIDDSVYYVGVKFMGTEKVKTEAGKFRCIKLVPILVADRMFKSEEGMTMWVTDDANRIPVRIESGISVGAVRADLVKYENLRNDLSAKL
jgi:hypothetical protein